MNVPPAPDSLTRDLADLPNTLPRPEGEFEVLKRAWLPPKGFAIITAVTNT